jgi:hypothetical protein
MEKRKCIMLDEILHKRLEAYCASEGISVNSYAVYCISTLLFAEEIESNVEYQSLVRQIIYQGSKNIPEEKLEQLRNRQKEILEEVERGEYVG